MSEQLRGSSVIPSVRYRDPHAAIAWLCRVLGFEKQAVFEDADGGVMHAQLTRGLGMVMLGGVQHGEYGALMAQPDETGGRQTASLCVIAEDCDAMYATAKAEGAEIVQELKSPEYGGKAFAVRDPEGHMWWVGSYDPWMQAGGAA